MGRTLLKWLAAVGTGAAAAVLAWISANMGQPVGVDPLIGGLAVALLAKIVAWLTSLIPATPAP